MTTQESCVKYVFVAPLRQIEWWVLNGPITKNEVLPATFLFFRKLCLSLRTSYKELIWCTSHPNVHIHNFWKHWSFIWGCFFSVCILCWIAIWRISVARMTHVAGECFFLKIISFLIITKSAENLKLGADPGGNYPEKYLVSKRFFKKQV